MATADKVIEERELLARFPELHPPLDGQSAASEANRCLFCFEAPCTAACPTHIDVPRFIKRIAQGNLRGAALAILDANILGASCSRVCPVEVLCEGACVYRRQSQRAIEIGRLQRHAMDAFFRDGAALPRRSNGGRPGRVACIGAGPASLACAAELRQLGFSVTVFEARPLPGGLNTYGVAEYKLRASESLREVELIRALGVEFRFGSQIAGQAALEALERDFDFIFVGVGLGAMQRLGIAGEDHPAVVDALEFIEGYKTGGRLAVGRRVIVVGAGNTAIDAARAARRLGAEAVRIFYRRDGGHMPAFSFEYHQARQEGVEFRWWTQPVRIHAANGSLELESVEVCPDGKGALEEVRGSEFRAPCDMVIRAIGQSPLLEFLRSCRGVRTEQGRVVVDRPTGRTANPRYFAGGDCVNGGREVVDAVADGKRAAAALARALEAVHA